MTAARLLGLLLLSAMAALPARGADLLFDPRPSAPPAISFTDADGRTLGLDAFKGKVVVLDYWATWCAPCRAEFPDLDRLQQSLGDKGLVVVAVSLDRNGRPAVDRFYDELKVAHLAKFLDPKNVGATTLGVRGLPTALIIDRQGREMARVEGETAWTGPAVTRVLNGLLAQ